MEITFLGHASFKIRGRSTDWVTIITDPYDAKMIGFGFPNVSADIVTVSHEHRDHSAAEAVKGLPAGAPKILRGPGEYEVKGITIGGVLTYHDTHGGAERGENTVFVITLEGVRMAHLGDLGHKLTDSQLSEIGNIDIVFVPVGGFYTFSPEVAFEVVTQLEPKIVLPMHYKEPGLAPDLSAKLANVQEFIKIAGIVSKNVPTLSVKKETLPAEMELVVLERKG